MPTLSCLFKRTCVLSGKVYSFFLHISHSKRPSIFGDSFVNIAVVSIIIDLSDKAVNFSLAVVLCLCNVHIHMHNS